MPFLGLMCTVDVGIGCNGRAMKRLIEPLVYRWGYDETVAVPSGFETDLASIPWPASLIFRPDWLWARAAVLHDWLYGDVHVDRFLADAMFRVAMREDGVPLPCRVVAFWAVRLFGRSHKRKLERRTACRLMKEMRS